MLPGSGVEGADLAHSTATSLLPLFAVPTMSPFVSMPRAVELM